MKNKKASVIIQISILFFFAITFGSSLGFLLALTQNTKNTENFQVFEPALPTKILDVNGELITEFSNDEKREIISYEDLPQILVDALVTREDRVFFSHKGYNINAIFRAVFGVVTGNSLGGASTLTQQIAGTLYCDRTEKSLKRKIKELWWSIQMERRLSKNEILEEYLNKIYFGKGTYGVNAASKYYFGHDATKVTPAEAAILVIQLSNPAGYNPFDHPDVAKDRQEAVLLSMADEGYITKDEAINSFNEYWDNFDYKRTSLSAYFLTEDKAPWFSEYVKRELMDYVYGSDDIYSSGFTVNTTLNLEHQAIAEEIMTAKIPYANQLFKWESNSRTRAAFDTYVPMAELIATIFGIPGLNLGRERSKMKAQSKYISQVNPVADILAMFCGVEPIKTVTNRGYERAKEAEERNTVEGTMISMENDTGFINAIVGGSKFDAQNQLIRATQARLQPGSSFKPLYYSAAIDSKKITPATVISDTPVLFKSADGQNYMPLNFKGEYHGNVPVYYSLIRSLNVPSIKILDTIGFDAAIDRALALLGIPEEEIPYRGFDHAYPIGLGTMSVKPIELCRAYAIFANGGKEITPTGIKTILKRNGDLYKDVEQDIRDEIAAHGEKAQIISPQTSFVMTKLLEQTITAGGTLSNANKDLEFKTSNGKSYKMPGAGKTGTTQNWADAWAVGYTPYYTAVFWFGFDKPGQSLGTSITGSSLAGPCWGEFIHRTHENLPLKQFPQVESGVVQHSFCFHSGQYPCKDCERVSTQWFLEGTGPTPGTCLIHSNKTPQILGENRIDTAILTSGLDIMEPTDTSPITVDLGDDDGNSAIPTDDYNSLEKKMKKDDDYNIFME